MFLLKQYYLKVDLCMVYFDLYLKLAEDFSILNKCVILQLVFLFSTFCTLSQFPCNPGVFFNFFLYFKSNPIFFVLSKGMGVNNRLFNLWR